MLDNGFQLKALRTLLKAPIELLNYCSKEYPKERPHAIPYKMHRFMMMAGGLVDFLLFVHFCSAENAGVEAIFYYQSTFIARFPKQ